jgi:hypothetical protein
MGVGVGDDGCSEIAVAARGPQACILAEQERAELTGVR